MTSVNYNASATAALRTLQATNQQLDAVQNRISTGFKIGEAKDNAAYWSISTTLKSDNKSLATVKDALGLGAATVDVAYEGLNAAKDVLDEIKSKLTSATQAGVDRAAVQADIDALQKQLESIANSSNFSGENWLSVDSAALGYSATKSVVASFSRDSSNAVTIGKIDVNTADIALFDRGGSGILDSQIALKAGNTFLTVGGNDKVDAPATTTLAVGAMTGGSASAAAKGRVANLGTLNLSTVRPGDRIEFALTSGTNSGTVVLNTTGLTDANFESSLQAAVDAALGGSFAGGTHKATVKVDAATKAVTIESVATGTSAVLTVGTAAGVDADGLLTSSAGLLTNASLPAPVDGTATPAQVSAGTFAAGAVANTDTLSFEFQYGLQTFTINHTFATDAGVDATEFAAILQGEINTALTGVTGYVANDLRVTIPTTGPLNGKIVLTTEAGEGYAVGVYNVTGTTAGLALGLAQSQSTATGSTSAAVVGYGTASAASMTVGEFDNADLELGDRISFQLNLKSGATDNIETISITTDGFSGAPADKAADASRFQAKVQAALDAAYGANQVVFSIDSAGGSPTYDMKFTTVAKGSDQKVIFGNVQTLNGDTVATGAAGLGAPTYTAGSGSSIGSNATVSTTTAFTGTQTFGDDDSVSFNLTVGATTRTVTVNKALVDSTLSTSTGSITNADDYVDVIRAAVAAAGFNTTTDLTVTKGVSNEVVFTKATAGGAIGVAGQTMTAGSSADTISVEEIDINSTAFKALSDTDKANVLSAYITVVNTAINSVTSAAAGLGSISKQIDLQKGFVDTLMDTIDKGVSGLVDADMSEESTKLQALQTKQQLGVQALSIANQSAQQLLRLFQ